MIKIWDLLIIFVNTRVATFSLRFQLTHTNSHCFLYCTSSWHEQTQEILHLPSRELNAKHKRESQDDSKS